MDIVEELIKKVQKECQKIKIQTIGKGGAAEHYRFRAKVEKESGIEAKAGKLSISKNASQLEKAIQGSFGKKLTETFDKQKDMLDQLY